MTDTQAIEAVEDVQMPMDPPLQQALQFLHDIKGVADTIAMTAGVSALAQPIYERIAAIHSSLNTQHDMIIDQRRLVAHQIQDHNQQMTELTTVFQEAVTQIGEAQRLIGPGKKTLTATQTKQLRQLLGISDSAGEKSVDGVDAEESAADPA